MMMMMVVVVVMMMTMMTATVKMMTKMTMIDSPQSSSRQMPPGEVAEALERRKRVLGGAVA
jgi:hypothetical protein